MRAFIAIIALAVCGCDPYYFGDDRTPDFVTKSGVKFYQNGVEGALTKEQAEEIEDFAWQIWAAVNGATAKERQDYLDCANGAYVETYARGSYRCNDFDRIFNPDKKCIGQYAGGAIEITTDAECPYYTPYAHEMFHMQQWCRWSKVDPNHGESIWEILRINEAYWKRTKCNFPIDFGEP